MGDTIARTGDWASNGNADDDHLDLRVASDRQAFLVNPNQLDKIQNPYSEWDIADNNAPQIRGVEFIRNNAPTQAVDADYFLGDTVAGDVDIVANCLDFEGHSIPGGIWDVAWKVTGASANQNTTWLFSPLTNTMPDIEAMGNVFSLGSRSKTQDHRPNLTGADVSHWYIVTNGITNTAATADSSWQTRGIPSQTSHRISREARFPDGRYRVTISARDEPGHQVDTAVSITVDNFAPYLERFSCEAAINPSEKYEGIWRDPVSMQELNDTDVTANKALTLTVPWTLKLNFSEVMDNRNAPTITFLSQAGSIVVLQVKDSGLSADSRTWTVTTESMPLGQNFSASGKLQVRVAGPRDLGNNRIDGRPKTITGRVANVPFPGGAPYDPEPDATWTVTVFNRPPALISVSARRASDSHLVYSAAWNRVSDEARSVTVGTQDWMSAGDLVFDLTYDLPMKTLANADLGIRNQQTGNTLNPISILKRSDTEYTVRYTIPTGANNSGSYVLQAKGKGILDRELDGFPASIARWDMNADTERGCDPSPDTSHTIALDAIVSVAETIVHRTSPDPNGETGPNQYGWFTTRELKLSGTVSDTATDLPAFVSGFKDLRVYRVGGATAGYSYLDMGTGAFAVDLSAITADGEHQYGLVAEDKAGNIAAETFTIRIALAAPYLTAATLKTGSTANLRYSAEWNDSASPSGFLDSTIQSSLPVDAFSKWTLELTFNSGMDTSAHPVCKVVFGSGAERTLTAPASGSATWSPDGRTFTLVTSSSPLGQNPETGTALLSVTAQDLSGRALDALPRTISAPQANGTLQNYEPGADQNHAITLEDWHVTLRGVVMDESGDSKTGARVRFYRDGVYDADIGVGVGASEGRWSRTRLSPGRYILYSYLKNFSPLRIDLGELTSRDSRYVEIRLPAQAVVAGLVFRTSDNAPVSDAVLTTRYTLDLSPDGDTTFVISTDTSGSGGGYAIGSLPGGQVTIDVGRDKYETAQATVSTTAGQTTNHDFALTPKPGQLVIETRRALNGDTVFNVSITATGINLVSGSGFANPLTGSTGATGNELFNSVGPALYQIVAMLDGYITETKTNIQVNPADTTTVVFLLVKMASYKAQIFDTHGNSISGVTATWSGSSAPYTTDGSGWFQIDTIVPGSYSLTLEKPGYVTRSASVTLADGEDKVDSFIMQKYGGISGHVQRSTNGTAIESATITVTGNGQTFMATSNSGGDFNIQQVKEGTYSVTAESIGFVTYTGSVTVPDGETPTMTIPMVPLGTLSGHVKNGANDAAIANATVNLTGGPQPYSTTTDGNGDFTIPRITAGNYTLEVQATGFAPVSQAQTISNGVDATVTISMTAIGQVSGAVTEPNGSGIGGATVSTGAISTTTAGDGSYTIGNLPYGPYTVTASRSGYTGGTPVSVTISQNPSTANFTLNPQPGSVSGSLNVSGTVNLYGIGTQYGTSYYFSNVPHGSYTIEASASGYITQTFSVGVSPGQNTPVNFTLVPPPPPPNGELEVNVRKMSNGNNVGDADEDVYIWGPVNQTKTTGRGATAGKCVFFNIPAGNYTVTVPSRGFSGTATVYGNQRTVITFGP